MSLAPDLHARIESLLHSSRVVLFMKGAPEAPQCGFSAKAVAALDALDTPYVHCDVLADNAIRDGIKLYGQWPTIPQLYIDGELVGGSDIIEQMANTGELHVALGLPPPDRTPPTVMVTPAAAAMLREAIEDAGGEMVVKLEIDRNFRTRLQLAVEDHNAITAVSEGVRVQVDLAGARRADGLHIDYADNARGRGLVIDNPNAPAQVRELTPHETNQRIAAGKLVLVDVRPPDERAQASVNADFHTLDDGVAALQSLPKDRPLAFLCHHGGRSAQAAEHFRDAGFGEVYNVVGGIQAWSETVDDSVPRY